MQTVDEHDRKAFAEIAGNSFIEYTDEEQRELAEMAERLRAISRNAQIRARSAS